MRRLLLMSVLLSIAAPALAGPGVDISANHICPGVAGASSDGGQLDCVALAQAHRYLSFYVTFIPAEDIPDLSNLDGRIDISVDSADPSLAFWDPSPGGCLDLHGGGVPFIGSKPTNGDPCGTDASIRQVFGYGSAMTPTRNSPDAMSFYFTVYNDYSHGGTVSVSAGQRLFGFEVRYDPAFASENGGACGTCCMKPCRGPFCEGGIALVMDINHAQPGSISAQPTTDLTTSTATQYGVGKSAYFREGAAVCESVPVQRSSWGRLKQLYR